MLGTTTQDCQVRKLEFFCMFHLSSSSNSNPSLSNFDPSRSDMRQLELNLKAPFCKPSQLENGLARWSEEKNGANLILGVATPFACPAVHVRSIIRDLTFLPVDLFCTQSDCVLAPEIRERESLLALRRHRMLENSCASGIFVIFQPGNRRCWPPAPSLDASSCGLEYRG